MAKRKAKSASKRRVSKFLETYSKGCGVIESMRAAGYSESTCKAGSRNLPRACREAVQAVEANKLQLKEQLGRSLTPDQRAAIVRGALLENVKDGTDRATTSLKLLAQDKELNLLTPDNVAGAIIINLASSSATPAPAVPLTIPAEIEEFSDGEGGTAALSDYVPSAMREPLPLPAPPEAPPEPLTVEQATELIRAEVAAALLERAE